MARVLVPLPDRDFDVTEVAVPWRLLTRAGHEVCSAPSAVTSRRRPRDGTPRSRGATSRRGTDTDDRHAFVVEDGTYVSARWPGDAYLFSKALLSRLPD